MVGCQARPAGTSQDDWRTADPAGGAITKTAARLAKSSWPLKLTRCGAGRRESSVLYQPDQRPCTSPLPKSRIMKGTKPPADSTCCLNRLRRSAKPSRRPVVAGHRHHHLWVGIRSAHPREMIQMAAVCRSEGKRRRPPGKRRYWAERRTGLSTLVEKDLWLWCPSLAAFTVARNRGTGIAEAAPCTRIGCCGGSG